MDLILVAVISLGAVGLIAAVILYVASKKFAVYEDPRIAQVAEVLPQANCGGCGYPGCSGFAEACVKAGSLEGKLCPVGGQEVMGKIAAILGLEAEASEPKVAVVRCNGSCENRPRIVKFYRFVYVCVVFVGPYLTVEVVWGVADILNGLMAFPNLVALVFLSPVVAKVTRDFIARNK
jgi:hypothetical protein